MVQLSTMMSDGERSAADDAAVIRGMYQRLLVAWNLRRAGEFGVLFAGDGLLVGFDGSQVGGSEVAAHLAPIFADHPTAAYVAKVLQIRGLGPDAVVLTAIAGMVAPGMTVLNPAANAVQTVVAERAGGGWRIVLFQNTPAQYHGRPEVAAQHTAELQPLVTAGVVLA
jgi:uncharacterized protein (TIGR02246 family)